MWLWILAGVLLLCLLQGSRNAEKKRAAPATGVYAGKSYSVIPIALESHNGRDFVTLDALPASSGYTGTSLYAVLKDKPLMLVIHTKEKRPLIQGSSGSSKVPALVYLGRMFDDHKVEVYQDSRNGVSVQTGSQGDVTLMFDRGGVEAAVLTEFSGMVPSGMGRI